MNVWYDYRTAWSRSPWLAILAAFGAVVVVVGVVGTVRADVLAIAFIPGLLVLLGHHLLVKKRS